MTQLFQSTSLLPAQIASFLFNLHKEACALINKDIPSPEDEINLIYAGPSSLDDPLALGSIIIDVIWILDLQLDETEKKQRLINVTKEIVVSFISLSSFFIQCS